MDYRKNIDNKKALNSFMNKVTAIAKTADEKIRELANEAESKIRETSVSFKESCQANLTNSFRKNIQSLAIEYVEKSLVANGVNDIKSLTIGVKETGEYLSVERIISDLCTEYSQSVENYMTDVYKYNLFGSLVLFFSSNEQIEFTKNDVEVFTLTLKEPVVEENYCEETTCECECTCHSNCSCECGVTCECNEECKEDCNCGCHTPVCTCDTNCDETCQCECHKQ